MEIIIHWAPSMGQAVWWAPVYNSEVDTVIAFVLIKTEAVKEVSNWPQSPLANVSLHQFHCLEPRSDPKDHAFFIHHVMELVAYISQSNSLFLFPQRGR